MLTDWDQIALAEAIADLLVLFEQPSCRWDSSGADDAIRQLHDVTARDPELSSPASIKDVLSILSRLSGAASLDS
ncbi:hypothetical protein [Pseudaminobacter sp. NGMCC 1.201702]|uniref:hypothetical protein n=1 Tax=Pseudaminobacter sp. NGMCC 1.201702 TaxID=3391825 RepID=UPI0039EF086A